MKVKVHHNGDDVLVAWKPARGEPIDGCLGFALLRRRNGVEEVVSTWVGFKGQAHKQGERRASTNWPIQKYHWTDYMARPGDRLQYRVVPMVGPDKANLKPATTLASQWTKEVTLTARVSPGVEVYFNRGIVASQWVSRRLGIANGDMKAKELAQVITTPSDPLRAYLMGPLGEKLLELLSSAAKQKRHLWAALYELGDEQLISALTKVGKKAHVILANGSVKKKGEDQNRAARERLKRKIDLHHRMVAPRALGHNKFLVIGDQNAKPRWVWTGSQNWTSTGLCTQANNSVLLDNPALAREYHDQWLRLYDAGDETPDWLLDDNSQPASGKLGRTPVRLWFTPTLEQVDLVDARKLIADAKQAILFLMFNPGPADSLLNQIIATARKGPLGNRLYVKGVINQDPSTSKTKVELFNGKNRETADFDVVLPAAIDEATAWFRRELKKLPSAFAMVHSKVVLIDPFTPKSVLITGSHNLGPKASGKNDENLLIFRGNSALASAYATNIMAIYNQYRWRFRSQVQPPAKRWKGLADTDTWQKGYLEDGPYLREIDFWTGK